MGILLKNAILDLINDTKRYLLFIVTLIIFFLYQLFELIPIKVMNLDINSIGSRTNALLTLFAYTCALFLCFILHKKYIRNELSNINNDFKKNIIFSIKYWILGLIIMICSSIILNILQINASNNNNVIEMFKSEPLINGISIVVFGPLFEELVFRMSFKELFSGVVFVLSSGITFGMVHVIFTNPSTLELLYLIPYCSLGIILSYIYYKTDKLIYPYIIHVLHNLLTTIIVLFMGGIL